MKNISKIIWGIVIIAAAVIFALNTLGVTNVDVLFPGWWTLFIIVPSLAGIFTDRDKSGSIVGLIIGVSLLLWKLEILDLSYMWEIIVVAVLLIIGIKLIVGGLRRKKTGEYDTVKVHVSSDADGTAIFGGREMNFDGQVFDGCELTAIFGGIECDLRRAIIEKDCHIRATAIFGGIDIKVPRGVNVKVSSTNIFGGTDDECDRDPSSDVTIYVEAVSIFGGVDIK